MKVEVLGTMRVKAEEISIDLGLEGEDKNGSEIIDNDTGEGEERRRS